MSELDPRLTPARPDLAAAHLEGRVDAARFVEPVDWQACVAAAPIRRSPATDGAMDDQVLAGEVFAVLEERDGWGWGWSRADGYVGWVDLSGFARDVKPVDRRVTALGAALDEATTGADADALRARILHWVSDCRAIDAELATWYGEAHYRDRGVVD